MKRESKRGDRESDRNGGKGKGNEAGGTRREGWLKEKMRVREKQVEEEEEEEEVKIVQRGQHQHCSRR